MLSLQCELIKVDHLFHYSFNFHQVEEDVDIGICRPIHQMSAILISSLVPFLILLSHNASFHRTFLDLIHCSHIGWRYLAMMSHDRCAELGHFPPRFN